MGPMEGWTNTLKLINHKERCWSLLYLSGTLTRISLPLRLEALDKAIPLAQGINQTPWLQFIDKL